MLIRHEKRKNNSNSITTVTTATTATPATTGISTSALCGRAHSYCTLDWHQKTMSWKICLVTCRVLAWLLQGPCLGGGEGGADKVAISHNSRRNVRSLRQVWAMRWSYSRIGGPLKESSFLLVKKWNSWLVWRPNIPVRLNNHLPKGLPLRKIGFL